MPGGGQVPGRGGWYRQGKRKSICFGLVVGCGTHWEQWHTELCRIVERNAILPASGAAARNAMDCGRIQTVQRIQLYGFDWFHHLLCFIVPKQTRLCNCPRRNRTVALTLSLLPVCIHGWQRLWRVVFPFGTAEPVCATGCVMLGLVV